jgi:hypothetical protein
VAASPRDTAERRQDGSVRGCFKVCNRAQQFAAVAQQNAELLQVLIRQIGIKATMRELDKFEKQAISGCGSG